MSQQAARQQVEYLTVKFGYDDPQHQLNELARDGWKVVEGIDRDGDTWAFLLERDANTATDGGEHGL